jgi:signal transduction histidine kinase
VTKDTGLNPAAQLRRRAEHRLAQGHTAAPLGKTNARRLLHELQVHQIELQMQNEALQASEAMARDAMQALEALNDQLEARVASRTAELQTMREAADAANRAKSQFLSNMSHELRTPLGGVLGMVELARRKAVDPQQIDWLDKARHAAMHLLSVVNDVLDVAKIEAGRLTLSNDVFTLGSLLSDLAEMLSPQLQAKHLAMDFEIDETLARQAFEGDRLRLFQVLLNLAGNAIKFTDHGGLTVRVQQDPGPDTLLRFEVQDTGIGIAAQDHGRLFTSFEQLDNSPARRQEGTGLGLALCKRMTELMGGQIGVQSTRGAGSLFWFTLRLRAVPAATATAAPSSERAAASPAALAATLAGKHSGAHILLAEDNPVNVEVMRALIEHAGLRVDTAPDGATAVAMARSTDYALILMDMQMPLMSGIDATRAIRAIPGRQQVPIVAVTANVFDDDRAQCLRAGMADHLCKPATPEALYSTLLKWLG